MPRIGVLYPGHSADDDFQRWVLDLGSPCEVRVIHTTIGEDAHREDALRDTGALHRLLEGAAQLRGTVDAATWACTSGSFVFGLHGATEQAARIQDYLGVPTSSTSLSFVAALQDLQLERVAIAASYPEEVAALFADCLMEARITVKRSWGLGIITGAEVGRLTASEVIGLVRENDHPNAVLVPDTAMHTAGLLATLEAAIGKPVLTANQVTVWDALRLAGRTVTRHGCGALFAPKQVPGRSTG